MARDILGILASSVPVERLFSQSALIMTNTRTSLKSKTMKALVSVNSWTKSSLRNKICGIDI